jgi:lysophospholipase L1-like esterase
MKIISHLSLAAALVLAATPALAAPPATHWVGTWATADIDHPNRLPASPAADSQLFAASPTTVREIVHLSIGGPSIRIELSNDFGTESLTITTTTVALAGDKGGLTGPATTVTFNGRPSIDIPAGGHILSDPIALAVPAQANLAISLFLPAQKLEHITQHNSAYQTNYLVPGNVAADPTLPDTATTFANWYFLHAVDVQAPLASSAVVAFGDSITDGTHSTPNENKRWPDVLARRLQANKATANIGVLNEGIGGNRVLHDGTGPNALARFDRDVLSLDGVKYLILLEAINDISRAWDPKKSYDVVSAEDLIQGFSQLVERAHAHGIKVFGATLTPYLGTASSSPAGEAVRNQVNAFIRSSKLFDGVIDFEAATIDKTTGAFDPRFNTPPHADHLHPNDAGMEAMGNAINLSLFTEK